MSGIRDQESGIRRTPPHRSLTPDPRSPFPDWDDLVLVGRIARPHGIKGLVVVNPETDFAEERFAEGATLWTRSPRGVEQLTVGSMRMQNGRPVVGFTGFGRIEDVEPLAGLELRVAEGALQVLESGAYYQHQLVGCAVETTAGEHVGEVARVDGGAAGSLLAVHGARGEILIPFAVDICVEVDVAGRRIRIDPPKGLLDLNVGRVPPRIARASGGPSE
jgi:16S rRNA processing protein RimM